MGTLALRHVGMKQHLDLRLSWVTRCPGAKVPMDLKIK
jgi:hypothetical protein